MQPLWSAWPLSAAEGEVRRGRLCTLVVAALPISHEKYLYCQSVVATQSMHQCTVCKRGCYLCFSAQCDSSRHTCGGHGPGRSEHGRVTSRQTPDRILVRILQTLTFDCTARYMRQTVHPLLMLALTLTLTLTLLIVLVLVLVLALLPLVLLRSMLSKVKQTVTSSTPRVRHQTSPICFMLLFHRPLTLSCDRSLTAHGRTIFATNHAR